MKLFFTLLFACFSLTVTLFGQMTPGTAGSNQNIGYNTVPQPLTATPPTGGTAPYAYQWQSSLDNNTFQNIDGATDLTYQPGALTVSTWYRQEQKSATPGEMVITNVVTIHVYGMGVEEESSFIHSVYPNPTNGLVTLECREGIRAEKLYTELYDSEGRRLFITRVNNGDGKITYSLASKPAGIYFLRVNHDNKTVSIRIVKN